MISKLTKNNIRGTIPVINVDGNINSALAQKVQNRLAKINSSRAVALAVLVNTCQGQPTQSQIIANKLKDYSIRHNLKLYTFARDVVASSGYLVLSAGDHVVADHASLVGNIGVVLQKYKMSGLLDQLQVDHKQFTTNNKLLQEALSPYRESAPNAKEYLGSLCHRTEQKLVRQVKKMRGNKIKDDGSCFSGELFVSREALERGLVDEVGSLVGVLGQRYPQAKLDLEGDSRWLIHKIFNL